jgi:hypothetical protein
MSGCGNRAEWLLAFGCARAGFHPGPRPVLRCHGCGLGFHPAMESEQDPAMMKKAHRAQMILYGVMILFAILPFILLWLKRRGAFN